MKWGKNKKKVQQDQPGLKASGGCERKGLRNEGVRETVHTTQEGG